MSKLIAVFLISILYVTVINAQSQRPIEEMTDAEIDAELELVKIQSQQAEDDMIEGLWSCILDKPEGPARACGIAAIHQLDCYLKGIRDEGSVLDLHVKCATELSKLIPE